MHFNICTIVCSAVNTLTIDAYETIAIAHKAVLYETIHNKKKSRVNPLSFTNYTIMMIVLVIASPLLVISYDWWT